MFKTYIMPSHDNKSIPIPGLGNQLHYASSNPTTYLDKTIMFYGASGTGKTVLMKHISYEIRDYIPNVIAVCPTNASNGSWTGHVPDNWIIENPTSEILANTLKRQKKATKKYKRANDPELLASIFTKIIEMVQNPKITYTKILSKRRLYINKIDMSSMSPGEKYEQKKHIEESVKKSLINLYKTTISNYQSKLLQPGMNSIFTKRELFAISHVNFNHRLLLILDDCGSRVKQWSKNQAISELFFEGRHYGITSFYALQDDKGLPPGIRKNAFINFFTESSSATSFFDAKCNAMTKKDKKEASLICDKLFSSENGRVNRKKLIFARNDSEYKFRYIIADLKPLFRLGCKAIWKLQDMIPKHNDSDSDSD
jgi:hypothetical protein